MYIWGLENDSSLLQLHGELIGLLRCSSAIIYLDSEVYVDACFNKQGDLVRLSVVIADITDRRIIRV